MLKKFLFLPALTVVFCLSALDNAPKSSWLIAEKDKKNASFDVFYIYPTLLKDKETPYPDLSAAKVRTRLKKFSAAQTGIFDHNARIFVPAVRQLEYTRCKEALKGYKNGCIDKDSPFYPGVADTAAAFRYYLKHWNQGRPYILFGHSQGAMVLYEVLKRVPEITPGKGFAAAYLPGLPGLTARQIREDLGKRGILPAEDEGSTGVVIIWNTQSPESRSSFTSSGGYGINPLNWRTDTFPAAAALHKGMVFFDHRTLAPLLWMHRNAPLPVCSAVLDKNGTLLVSDVPSLARKLYEGLFGPGCFHAGDIWLFAGNIASNARLRTALHAMKNEFDKAVSMVKAGEAECVLLRQGRIAAAERGRGVSPLLRLYERDKKAMEGAVIVDKVIGRAAAAIAINGKAKHVYGLVMSEDAQRFLQENGISSSCSLKVHRILNRKRNGLCPLEQSVQGINDPRKALEALKKKIAVLMQENRKK
ncbi:MAG: DUF1893 domain-containing protein [Lentisphaeria bacterium]|nr:DUF1893 domain-containing protein [Lentisphaeria bacterium]